MAMYTLLSRIPLGFHNTKLQNPESSRSLDPSAYALQRWPELRNLQATPEEKLARASALAQLTEIQKNPEKAFGSHETKWFTDDVSKTKTKISEIIQALKTQPLNSPYWGTFDRVSFNGWDTDGSADFSLVRGTNKTNRMFLTQILRNNSQLAARIFSPITSGEVISENSDTFKQIQSLQRFLLAYEQREPDFSKRILRLANEALIKGQLDKAVQLLREPLKDKNNLNIDSLLTSRGVNNALRSIGDTRSAGEGMVMDMTEGLKESGLTPEQIALSNSISEAQSNPSYMASKRTQGENLYNQTLQAIPEGDPQRIIIQNNRGKMIKGFADQAFFMEKMTDYIARHGSQGLGDAASAFDDMKGLSGTLNWSDENVKIGKDVLIMLASFVLTAGVGTLLTGLANAARFAQVATNARSVKSATDAARFAAEGRRARAALSTGSAKITSGVSTAARYTAVGADKVVKADAALTGAKYGVRYGNEALKFTTAHAALKSFFRNEGEHSGFDGFFTDLAKNTVMFAAFGGMEKFVTGPAKARIIEKFGIQNTAAKFTIGTTVLTTGDIAVMQGLHAAETGKLEWDWQSVYTALAFRIGMKGAENLFPKLSQKYNTWKERKGNTTSAEQQKAGSSSTQTTHGESVDRAHGAPLEPLNDKNHLVIKTDKPSTSNTPKKQDIAPQSLGMSRSNTVDQNAQRRIDDLTGVSHSTGIKESDLLRGNQTPKSTSRSETKGENEKVAVLKNEKNTTNTELGKSSNENRILTDIELKNIDEQIQSFFKANRISNWEQFESQLNELKKREREIRLGTRKTNPDGSMRTEPGNTRHTGDHMQVKTALDKYSTIKSLQNKKELHSTYTQRHLESNPEVQSFFKANRISNWEQFESQLNELKKREREIRLGTRKTNPDGSMRTEPGNTRHTGDHMQVKTALDKYEYISSLVPNRVTKDFLPESSKNLDPQNKINSIDDRTSLESSLNGGQSKISDIEARKQAIRSRLGDNTNVLAELRKAEERIKNMSDEQVLKEAIGKTNKPDVVIPVAPIIPGISSKFETTQPPKNSSAETQKPTEAIDPVVAFANADAIGNRIADMAGKKDPEAGKILASGDSGKIKEALSSPSNWKKWTAIAGLLGLILLGLSQCHKKEQIVAGVSPEDVERDTPVPTAVDIVSPEATAIYCEKLANPVASSLNTTRSSAASENVILTEKRRENISKRWMQSSEWQNVLNEWNTNLINIPEDAQNMMKDVLITPSPENVRKLQQLIGMEAIDQSVGQDGILGTNTTREIGEYVNSCNVKPTLPLTPSA